MVIDAELNRIAYPGPGALWSRRLRGDTGLVD